MAKQYHPDVNKEAGADEKFKEIGEAYSVLSDPEKEEHMTNLVQLHLMVHKVDLEASVVEASADLALKILI